MALNRHSSMQFPHFVHLDWSMTCGSFGSPDMASAGQFFLQRPQPVQASPSMTKVVSGRQMPAGQRFL